MANETSSLHPHEIILSEEEIFDVGLATFYSFDKEKAGATRSARHLKGGPCVQSDRHLKGGPCSNPGSSWG
jgi:hypothetical protein